MLHAFDLEQYTLNEPCSNEVIALHRKHFHIAWTVYPVDSPRMDVVRCFAAIG